MFNLYTTNPITRLIQYFDFAAKFSPLAQCYKYTVNSNNPYLKERPIQSILGGLFRSISKQENIPVGCVPPLFTIQGVSVWRWGLCLGRIPNRDSLNRDPPRTVKSGRYASYWNAFLSNIQIVIFSQKWFYPSYVQKNWDFFLKWTVFSTIGTGLTNTKAGRKVEEQGGSLA